MLVKEKSQRHVCSQSDRQFLLMMQPYGMYLHALLSARNMSTSAGKTRTPPKIAW